MKSGKNSNHITMANTLWRLAERSSAKLVSFVVSVILARILGPSVYGTVSLIIVIISVMQIFVDTGLTSALVQKDSTDTLDFSTIFYFNLAVCILLYLIMYLSAPQIAAFFKNPEMTPMIRVLSLIILISGVRSVSQAFIVRNLMFRKFFFATLTGTIISAFVGIYMAVSGCGVWALIVQHLVNLAVDTAFLWYITPFRPVRAFSVARLRALASFGGRILIAELIERIYNNLRAIIIGRKFTKEDLAMYSKGRQFPEVIAGNINDSIDSVLFPIMAKAQNDKEKMLELMKSSIQMSTFIIAPLMTGLFVTAPILVKLFLTDVWLPCVPYLRIFSFTFLLYPIHTVNLNAVKALGRSDMLLKIEFLKKAYGLIILIITMQYSVLAIAAGVILIGILGLFVNSYPNQQLTGYGLTKQFKDYMPAVLISFLMGVIITPLAYLNIPQAIILLLQIILGGCSYLLLSKVFKIQAFAEMKDFIFNLKMSEDKQ